MPYYTYLKCELMFSLETCSKKHFRENVSLWFKYKLQCYYLSSFSQRKCCVSQPLPCVSLVSKPQTKYFFILLKRERSMHFSVILAIVLFTVPSCP